ncbi:hypothetical protein SAMN05216389_101186 [Oceanobacillus limi]|uniref:Uncharacterized protein n=1 Tax=Oceanobacillus limi TaxID=930131 RepID=A0A1H9Y5P6_9BACI|nr:hypothetical protein [Oceanobacillus limi]SES63731.1 hypothetical protein SAMN05216389_101186 [Oceanobacillus limi]
MKKGLLSLFLLLFILSACNTQNVETNYYLSLNGASETWEISGYEIVITSDEMKAGNGKLFMKNHNEFFTDSFRFKTIAMIDGVETTIHSSSVTGETDISEQMTGTIEGEGGNSIDVDNLSEIYMIVEWWDADKNETLNERIDLYQKPESEDTFLH